MPIKPKHIIAAVLALLAASQTSLEGQPANLPDSSCIYIRITDAIAKEIGGGCSFNPAGNYYLPASVSNLGLVGGVLSTFDRINRSGRIGMSGMNRLQRDSEDHRLHEGTEAYMPNFRVSDCPALPAATVYDVTPGSCNAAGDWQFINYLLTSGMTRDAEAILYQNGRYAPSDTLSYLRGLAAYCARDYATTIYQMERVSHSSPLYDSALFHSSASYMELGCHNWAETALEEYTGQLTDLKLLHLEAAALLKGDNARYMALSASDSLATHYPVVQAQHALSEIFHDRAAAGTKKPWVAATASAIIPGLGKIYAGDLSEGLAAFLVVGSFGAVTAECIAKRGCSDWRSIAFGTIGTLFYFGNIYGSHFSVERLNSYTNEIQNKAIMYNIHLPLRTLFRQWAGETNGR